MLAVVMMLVMAAGPALAKQGPNRGNGDQIGGGNLANPDNGQHKAVGGGQFNNPHVGF